MMARGHVLAGLMDLSPYEKVPCGDNSVGDSNPDGQRKVKVRTVMETGSRGGLDGSGV